jgi:hypothetical protein
MNPNPFARTGCQIPFLLSLLVMFIAGGLVQAQSSQRQFDQLPAAWGDLDSWSRYLPATDETELGMGLKTAGQKTTMLIAFSARMKGVSPTQPASEVFVHASAGVQSNGREGRNKTLRFVLASGPANGSRTGSASSPVLDLSSRLGADDETPGARVNFATAKLAPAEFLRIVRSGQPTATVLGVDVTFRPDQLEALRAFADQIFPKGARAKVGK